MDIKFLDIANEHGNELQMGRCCQSELSQIQDYQVFKDHGKAIHGIRKFITNALTGKSKST